MPASEPRNNRPSCCPLNLQVHDSYLNAPAATGQVNVSITLSSPLTSSKGLLQAFCVSANCNCCVQLFAVLTTWQVNHHITQCRTFFEFKLCSQSHRQENRMHNQPEGSMMMLVPSGFRGQCAPEGWLHHLASPSAQED